MKVDIGFVILHYNAIQETKDCIRSVEERLDTSNYQIVVVDNCSPNGSGRKLQAGYRDSERVHVIVNHENQGFAKGNNLGYQYLLDHYDVEFVCIMNNDTLVIQDDFFRTVQQEYRESHFAVMGPRIVLRDGTDHPVYVKFPSRQFIEREIRDKKRELFLLNTHLDHFVTAYKLAIRNPIRRLTKKHVESKYKDLFRADITEEWSDSHVLHGCCLVFSKAYMNAYDDAFCPDTFVYKEEELLYLRCRKKQLKMIYNPKLLIKHLEDVSTDTLVKKGRKKLKFRWKHEIDSYGVVLRMMDDCL